MGFSFWFGGRFDLIIQNLFFLLDYLIFIDHCKEKRSLEAFYCVLVCFELRFENKK